MSSSNTVPGSGVTLQMLSIEMQIRELCAPDELDAAFREALMRANTLEVSPSMACRQTLASLVVENPALLQRNFTRHSVAELATSRTLMGVAQTVRALPLREDLLRHSRDELKHSKLFGALATGLEDLTGTVDRENYEWILENDRKFLERYNGNVLDFLCDVLASEVRTHKFLSGYLAAIEHQKYPFARKMQKVLRNVLDDERRHITYTARYVNGWIREGAGLAASIEQSFRAIDRNSWVEIAETARFFYERT